YHLILLAQNDIGLQNLIKLSSRAYTEGFYHKPRIDDALLADYSEGIIATSACLGSRSSFLIEHGRTKEAERLLQHHAEIFKDRFFLELQLHQDEKQIKLNQELLKLGSRLHLPPVVTADSHYTHITDKGYHELAL